MNIRSDELTFQLSHGLKPDLYWECYPSTCSPGVKPQYHAWTGIDGGARRARIQVCDRVQNCLALRGCRHLKFAALGSEICGFREQGDEGLEYFFSPNRLQVQHSVQHGDTVGLGDWYRRSEGNSLWINVGKIGIDDLVKAVARKWVQVVKRVWEAVVNELRNEGIRRPFMSPKAFEFNTFRRETRWCLIERMIDQIASGGIRNETKRSRQCGSFAKVSCMTRGLAFDGGRDQLRPWGSRIARSQTLQHKWTIRLTEILPKGQVPSLLGPGSLRGSRPAPRCAGQASMCFYYLHLMTEQSAAIKLRDLTANRCWIDDQRNAYSSSWAPRFHSFRNSCQLAIRQKSDGSRMHSKKERLGYYVRKEYLIFELIF